MRIISSERARTLYHDSKGYFIPVDCKVECGHCRSDGTSDGYHSCLRCNGHKWLWGSVNEPGYGFTPYTLTSIYF